MEQQKTPEITTEEKIKQLCTSLTSHCGMALMKADAYGNSAISRFIRKFSTNILIHVQEIYKSISPVPLSSPTDAGSKPGMSAEEYSENGEKNESKI